jgi:hypothetical protein
MIEEEVNKVNRTYLNVYWFDDVDKTIPDFLNSDEWETIGK